MSISQMVSEMKSDRKFVPSCTPYQLGRKMYRAGKPYSDCVTDEMRSGWLAAENTAAWAYYNAMDAEGLAAQAVQL